MTHGLTVSSCIVHSCLIESFRDWLRRVSRWPGAVSPLFSGCFNGSCGHRGSIISCGPTVIAELLLLTPSVDAKLAGDTITTQLVASYSQLYHSQNHDKMGSLFMTATVGSINGRLQELISTDDLGRALGFAPAWCSYPCHILGICPATVGSFSRWPNPWPAYCY